MDALKNIALKPNAPWKMPPPAHKPSNASNGPAPNSLLDDSNPFL
jgi:hypothetical protein